MEKFWDERVRIPPVIVMFFPDSISIVSVASTVSSSFTTISSASASTAALSSSNVDTDATRPLAASRIIRSILLISCSTRLGSLLFPDCPSSSASLSPELPSGEELPVSPDASGFPPDPSTPSSPLSDSPLLTGSPFVPSFWSPLSSASTSPAVSAMGVGSSSMVAPLLAQPPIATTRSVAIMTASIFSSTIPRLPADDVQAIEHPLLTLVLLQASNPLQQIVHLIFLKLLSLSTPMSIDFDDSLLPKKLLFTSYIKRKNCLRLLVGDLLLTGY